MVASSEADGQTKLTTSDSGKCVNCTRALRRSSHYCNSRQCCLKRRGRRLHSAALREADTTASICIHCTANGEHTQHILLMPFAYFSLHTPTIPVVCKSDFDPLPSATIKLFSVFLSKQQNWQVGNNRRTENSIVVWSSCDA